MIPQGPIVGFDAELLPDDHIILTLSKTGLFEIDREGNILWSHLDPDVSHDADLLVLPQAMLLLNQTYPSSYYFQVS